jgi:hypothetical protein
MNSTTPYKPNRHPHNTGRIFDDYDDDKRVIYSQVALLDDLWDTSRIYSTYDGPAYGFLAFKSAETGKWLTKTVDANKYSRPEVAELLERYSRWRFDQYFCPNLFSDRRRIRQFALPTWLGWCDMDESDPGAYDPWPSIVWETSPQRYQAIWAWDQLHTPKQAEAYSKALTYRHGGDRNGWSYTKMLRLIGSVNHKPEYDEPIVRAVSWDWSRIEARPVPLPTRHKGPLSPLPDIDVDPTRYDRAEVIRRYRSKLHLKARTLMANRKVYEPDRSACIFFMIRALHEAGASHDEIACVIWPSPYFIEKHGQRLDKLNEEIARITGKAETDNE